jgi:hypothetical protein
VRTDVKVSMPTQPSVEQEFLLLLARRARQPSTTEVYQELAEMMRLSSKQLSLKGAPSRETFRPVPGSIVRDGPPRSP